MCMEADWEVSSSFSSSHLGGVQMGERAGLVVSQQ